MIKSICFIGGGNMAEAMISGMVNSSYESQSICVVDRNELKRESLKSKYGIRVSVDLIEEVEKADILVLAIKPQQMSELILEIKDTVKDQLIVTVAAGIEVVVYEKLFSKPICISRTIPNTPSSIGFGATGIYFNENVTKDHEEQVINMMSSIGIVEVVEKESMIDVIAACASSGPAYYLQFMECMVAAVVKQGLDKEKAERLVIQTCLGAAQMAKQSDKSISTLRENVTSKKGITAAALNVFEKSNLGDIVREAIDANIDRANELSKEISGKLI
ncbi:pyrroline-5-carboxylate reductase [Francisella sp. Scap27]|uniref:pyrroline-5-carboxylate reductase n=1 Tax=Francisella sp. Scap27 TaxID=2589986 RepID=UPI0015BC9592|nr:pyrroline-5-carboxylate reductase [Francisella sp. Scap27]QLE79537.1 pyrroline-5-carboxylate reductase [Francisella sp. Scap27]